MKTNEVNPFRIVPYAPVEIRTGRLVIVDPVNTLEFQKTDEFFLGGCLESRVGRPQKMMTTHQGAIVSAADAYQIGRTGDEIYAYFSMGYPRGVKRLGGILTNTILFADLENVHLRPGTHSKEVLVVEGMKNGVYVCRYAHEEKAVVLHGHTLQYPFDDLGVPARKVGEIYKEVGADAVKNLQRDFQKTVQRGLKEIGKLVREVEGKIRDELEDPENAEEIKRLLDQTKEAAEKARKNIRDFLRQRADEILDRDKKKKP